MKFIRRSFLSMLKARISLKLEFEKLGLDSISIRSIVRYELAKFKMRRRAVNAALKAVGV